MSEAPAAHALQPLAGLPPPGTPIAATDEASKILRQAAHKAIAAVTGPVASVQGIHPRIAAACFNRASGVQRGMGRG